MKISVVIPNYNNSSLIAKCLDALINQELDDSHSFQIIVVDDGSTDNSADLINDAYENSINLIKLPVNQGRSTARNIGAKSSDADYLIFIDSDCIPTDTYFIQSYLQAIQNGGELIFGQVVTIGNNFWDKLQQTSFKSRLNEFNKGNKWVYTTCNVCIKKSLFIETGGFDLAFNMHGFEDRDLFIKLLKSGATCQFTKKAIVTHEDAITLKSVSSKLFNAGRYASHIFYSAHPDTYQQMSYSKIDCYLTPQLRFLDIVTWPIARFLASTNSNWLEYKTIPFSLRSMLARIIYGLHFLHGTVISYKSRTSTSS